MFKFLEKILIPFVGILIIFSANAAYSSSKEFVLRVEGKVGTQCNTWASRYFGTGKTLVTELLIKVDESGIISGTSEIISGNTFIRDYLTSDPKLNRKKGDKWAGGDVWSVSGTMSSDGSIQAKVDLGDRKHWALVRSLRGNLGTQKLFVASGRQSCINWRKVSVVNSKINLSDSSASSAKNNGGDELSAAKTIIKDSEEFLKSGAGSFTLEFTNKYIAVKDILRGKWNATLKDNFINFKEYVYSNKDFKKYSDMQNNKRIEEALDDFSNNMQLLQDLRDKLKKWLQKNLIHEKAGSAYDLVARCDELLNSNNYDDIELTIINAAKLVRELEILD